MNKPRITSATVSLVVIVSLGIAHSVLSYISLSTKSPTFDEPIHALGGFSVRFLNDYRIDPEDPALWHRIHALAASRKEAEIDQNSVVWKRLPDDSGLEFLLAYQTYFETRSVSVETLMNRRRALLSIFGAATVMGSGLLARNLAGSFKLPAGPSGVFTSGLLAFDPNLLAHSSIIKNDVMMALLMLGTSAALWSILHRVRWQNTACLITCLAIAPVIKFSGVLLAPIAGGVLLVRALMPAAWYIGRKPLLSRASRVAVPIVLIFIAAVTGYLTLWASYGMRFQVTNDGSPFSFDTLTDLSRTNLYEKVYHSPPLPEVVSSLPADNITQIILAARDAHVAPESWLYGLLHVHVFSARRSAYLFGEYSDGGFWYYFPSIFILKTPIATLVLFFGMIGLSSVRFRTFVRSLDGRWALISIAIPALLLLVLSMRSGLNIGIRHILPVWPAMYIGIGLFSSWLWVRRSSLPRYVMAALAILSISESVAAAPNYISFLNVVAKRMNHQLGLLSDSNLDWGQDLPALAKWQRSHSDVPLYFAYFGTADPGYYGINYINIKPGYLFVQNKFEPDPGKPGVIAYSASILSGVYHPHLREELRQIRLKKPIRIIGGSIYLYKWPFDMPDDQWQSATGITIER